MSQTLTRKLLVVGGTGLLGSSICKHSVAMGWETVSLSRRGEPDSFKTGVKPRWAEEVHWASGNCLEPSTYKHLLENVTDVVHTMGIISELNYKGVVGAKSLSDFACGLGRMAKEAMGMHDRGNPLKEEQRPTFEMMNRDTAITLAQEVARVPTIDAFVYISASDSFPFINPRYFSSKRQAEQYLFSRPEFRSIVFRPGFMYSKDRMATTPLATAIQLANFVTKPVARELESLPLGASLTTPPLHVDTVAQAIVAAIEKPGLKGIFDIEGIQKLSRGM